MDKIRHLEHITLRAWAALKTETYDGWILRFAKGYTGRANSVQPLDSTSLAIDEKIAYCENWYANHDLPCIFRLTDAMQPDNLDQILEQRNYERYNETIVKTAPLSNLTLSTDSRFRFDQTVSDTWIEAWGEYNNIPKQHIATAKTMLSRTSANMCFAWIDDKAVGLAVQATLVVHHGTGKITNSRKTVKEQDRQFIKKEDNYVGLFDIVVHPEYRKQGLGKALVMSLLQWGKEQGSSIAYLQVVADNVPALALYDKLGFTTHHHYWYRRQQVK